ncbi:NAD(P)H-binding protein [Hymenobacter sp. HMF4947]|uniref:NAD(P)H-binding protein n=1 Tax=Hymenobacter ginkgonis TaxID=2682976 RepID=A0A7K1T8Q7_9BACT|nr:NAD(P)H-binding protein [Hymenobacter ginkgonis]MVN74784.1 NAD(P)H-binding protein [Hymenobacter ginkgonis]
MKNVLVVGASGTIAGQVIALLAEQPDLNLTLFLRSARRLHRLPARARVVEGDALNYDHLKAAVAGQDVVYVNLAGDLKSMAQNIARAMHEARVKRVIFVSSIGIYDAPLKPVLKPYRAAADVFETSALDYTILRPAWFTTANEVDFEITKKGTPEKGSVISQKSLATFIAQLIESPEKYVRESLGINKPLS